MLETRIRLSLTFPITVLSVSDGIDALLGFKPDDFLAGKVLLIDRLHTHDHDIADDLFSTDISDASGTFNIRLRHADGRIRCVKGEFTKEPDNSGSGVILELLLQEGKSLRQPRDAQPMMTNFVAMMETTDDYIYFKDRNHVFTGASQTLVSITAPSEHWTDLLGLTDYDVFPEEYADIYYRLEKQVFAGIPVAREIQKTLDNDGNIGWVDNRKYPIKNEIGDVIGLFGIARVITPQILAEQGLRESEALLRESHAIAGMGSYVLDFPTGLWKNSETLDQLFGIDALYERSVEGWKNLIHPGDRTMMVDYLRDEIIGQGNAFDMEYRIIRHDDQAERWMHGLGRLEFDAQGHPVKMHGTIQDITERKRDHRMMEMMKFSMDHMADNVTWVTSDAKVVYANLAACSSLGYTMEEMLQMRIPDFDPDFPAEIWSHHWEEIRKYGSHTFETRHRTKSGEIYPVEVSVNYMRFGDVEFNCGFARNITKRKEAEQAVQEAKERAELIIQTSPDAVLISRLSDGHITDVNNAFSDLSGYTKEESIGNTTVDLNLWVNPTDREKFIHDMQTKGVCENFEAQFLRKNGAQSTGILSARITVIQGVPHIISTIRDITERKAAEEKIQYLGFYDVLTQLPNRRLLMDRLHQALASSERIGRLGALLFIDLDNFKTLNDNFGHHIGDMYLQQIAKRLTACVRDGDTVARLGGDEFVVVLENLSEQPMESAAQTESISKKILMSLSQPYQLDLKEYLGTASIGAAVFKGHNLPTDELLKQADIAMYQAKKAGRNTVRFFDQKMQENITNRFSLEAELRKALENQEFQLYYQIQVDSKNRPLGAEALIRWIHPERGLVPPMQFIPLSEETGLILPIGLWVLEAACAQLRAWQEEARTMGLVLAVNVSARQFYQSDFVTQVEDAVQRHGIIPRLLKLELTEGMLLENIEQTIVIMHALKKIGIQFSLDDFGTGYSSLQYLKRLPLDQIKIDQSFVRDITSDPNDAAIVQTIIAMAETLELKVVAEGVETEAQREFLELRGCKHFQGYLFGRPVPIEQFEELLKRG